MNYVYTIIIAIIVYLMLKYWEDRYRVEKITSVINPIFWISNYKVNKTWSNKLLKLIEDKTKIIYLTEYQCKFKGDVTVWVENYPYAYGHKYSGSNELPKRYVRILLKNYIKNECKENRIKRGGYFD